MRGGDVECVQNYSRRRPFGRIRCRYKGNIKMNFKEIG